MWPEPPIIRITGRREDGRVMIAIRDNGEGVEPQNLARIFDPFFTTRDVGKGMGMGDVKLALFVGFALGLTIGIRALLVTALAGGAFAVLLMLIRIRKRQDIMPYGPFISAGALALLFWQGVAFASAN